MLLIKVTGNGDRFCASVNLRHFKITFHSCAQGQKCAQEEYFNAFYGPGSTIIIHMSLTRSLILKALLISFVFSYRLHRL